MDSVTQETSPARSSKGLKSVLRKARPGRKDNASTLSVNGTDNSSNGRGGIRSSIDSTVGKLKSHTTEESSQNDGDDTGSHGISKLIPARIRKKRRKAREAAEQDEDGAARGRSIGDRPSNGAIGDLAASEITGESQSTLDDDDDGSSLITYDSDPEP